MGLDITHYKATLEKASTNDLFYIGKNIYGETGAEIKEKFDGFNVEFDHFSKYIQEVDVPNEVESVIIIKGSEHVKKVKDYFQSVNIDTAFLIRENEKQLENSIHDFEKKKGYQKLKKNIKDINYRDWMILKYYMIEKKEGFYFKSIGDQRKGMNAKFWDRFGHNDKDTFALREDFDYAFSCVDYYWETDTAEMVKLRKEEFKKTFIDNFELGASFMSLSY